MTLKEYRKKRNFQKTSEPAPPETPPKNDGRLIYMIQKHDATRLHYDFRLEVDGVLKSWPIPKGPSLDPKDKRLAVMVEDHPLSYASFEGVIPKGEYGGGPVIVWDAGTYSPDEDGVLNFDDRDEAERRMREGIEKGKISIYLQGQKLRGSFTLVKLANSEKGKDWLFIKHKDRYVDPDRDVVLEDRSVISGLSIADLKAGRLPDPSQSRFVVKPEDAPGAKRAPFPKSIEPMQATLSKDPFDSPDWDFEPKMDGVRAVVYINGDVVRIDSRRGLDATKQYPTIVAEMAEQTERHMILDAEIVALDERGVPSFQTIQQRLNLSREADIRKMEEKIPVYLYAFDLLYANGYDLRNTQLRDRKTLLKQLLQPTDHVFLLEHFEQDGKAAYTGAVAAGLEGVMAKKRDSLYESGRRSKVWLKVKGTSEEEFVVGGYTGGTGGRSKTFGSLLVGQYDDKGKLVYSGNVGTGFDEKMLKSLLKQLKVLEVDKSPFDVMTPGTSRFGRPKDVPIYWTKPQLVARVKFAEWTNDGHLRAPSFIGMRTDKDPKDVHREVVVTPPDENDPPEDTLKRRGAKAKKDDPPAGDSRRAPSRKKSAAQTVDDGIIADVLEQLANPAQNFSLRVGAQKVAVTNLDKPLWPAYKDVRPLTKRDLLTYFARVSPYLLPQMHGRVLTLTRYPNGIDGKSFYQKHWEQGKLPEYVEPVIVYSGQFDKDQEYLLCNNLPTLLWLGQLADIELHTWYSRVDPEPDAHNLPIYKSGGEEEFDASILNYPDYIVFDLDPYIYSGDEKKGAEPELNRAAFLKTCDVAFWLKDLLDSLSLSSFVKTTGKTGLHIYVPIIRHFTYDEVRSAAETIGRFLMQQHPHDITMEWATVKRKGKIFFDHGQNTKGKTLASLYSPRPQPWAGVSMPVLWSELRDIYPTHFTIQNACERLEKTGDLWANILDEKHDLAAMLGAVRG
ncbi:MAG: non-homologous end-joining DNA ligase [Chloroflexota bacterium]